MLVSVVIPARNWDGHLVSTLGSIATQVLPADVTLETIVGLAAEPPARCPDGVRVVHNPSGTIPDALNLAIAESRGEVIVRVDSRTNLQQDHMARTVAALEDPAVGCVGGAQLVMDRGVFGSAYAVAFNSPLLGPSAYRYRRSSGPVDTAYLGAWRTTELRALGGFNAQLLRNQDNELAERVRASGHVVLFEANLVVGYLNGRGLRSTVAHHHEFGAWRVLQSSSGTRGLGPKHAVALGIGAGTVVTGLAALARPRSRRLALGAAGSGYVAATALAYRSAIRLRRARQDLELAPLNPVGVALAPALAAVVNAAWVGGLIRGVLRSRPSTH